MKLENEFVVPASVDDAWGVLLNVERVAPCLPGAEVEKSEGDSYNGTMTVKIGPITAKYKGTIEIEEADEAAHRAVMKAKARDARGQGGAQATITSVMESTDDGTRVKVETDMRVTGAAAQFGRGVMQDVSAQMMGRFAECLAKEMGDGGGAAEAEKAPAAAGDGSPAETSSGEAPTAAPLPADAPRPPGDEPEKAEPEAPATVPGGAAAGTGASGAEAAGPVTGEPAAPERERPTPDVLDLGELGKGVMAKRAAPLVGGLVGALALLFLLRHLRGRRR
jgi:carbon monoxide dehydrogenase subunit G